MKTDDEIRKQFEKDVADHVLTVKHEAGLYRHLYFGKPGDGNMAFSVVTWPGWLCYSGDMGTYVFSRLPDMFAFFRRPEGELSINPDYWAQKCEGADKVDGIRAYDPELFRAEVAEWLDAAEASPETREEVEALVLAHAEDGEVLAREAVCDFKAGDGFEFRDFHEADCRRFTFRFLWCLHAVVWGIRQWDAREVEPATLLPTILVEPPGTVAAAPGAE